MVVIVRVTFFDSRFTGVTNGQDCMCNFVHSPCTGLTNGYDCMCVLNFLRIYALAKRCPLFCHLYICYFFFQSPFLISTVINVEVVVTPVAINKNEFETVTFECTVSGTQHSSYWKRKGTDKRVGEGRFLQLRNLRQEDSDEYCCVVDISEIQMEQDCGTLGVGEYQS